MKTTQKQTFKNIVGIATLMTMAFSQTAFAATAVNSTVEGYGTDTIAGYETQLKTNTVLPFQDVSFKLTKPDGTVLNLNGNSGQNGVAQISLDDYHTQKAGIYNVQAALTSNNQSLGGVHSFVVFPDKVSADQSLVSIDKTVAQPGSKDSAHLSVQLLDKYKNPVVNHLVQVFSNRSDDHVINLAQNGVTDNQGKINFALSAPQKGVSEYTVLDATAGTMLSHKISVAYVESSQLMADAGGDFPFFIDTANAAAGSLQKFSISGLPDNIQPNQNINFTITAQDDSAQTVQNYTGKVHFSAEGANSNNVSLPEDYTFKAEDLGTHQFSLGLSFTSAGNYKIVVTDLNNTLIQGTQDVTVGGNGGATQQSNNANITVDTPIAGTYSQKTQTISGKATSGYTVKIYDNQQEIGSVQATSDGKYSYQTTDLTDGVHTIYAVMFDNTQTAKGTSTNVQFNIDTTPPSVDEILLDPSSGIQPGTPINVTITSEENLSQAAVVFNGDITQLNPSLSNPGTYVGSIQAPQTAGLYPIDVLLVDQLSNEGSYKGKAQVTVSADGGTIVTQEVTQEQTQQTEQQTQEVVTPPPVNAPPSKVSGLLTYAGDRKVTLVWDAAADADTFVQHYRIYYGTDPRNLDQNVDTKDASTTWYVPNLQNGKEYYFAVSAFDSAGLESAGLSEIVTGIPFAAEVASQPTPVDLHPAATDFVPPTTAKSGPELLWVFMGSGVLGGITKRLRRKNKK